MKPMHYAPRSALSGKKGFTLVEILIVVAITAMLSSFALTYSRISARQVALFVEEQKIAGLILRAKELSLTAYIQPVATCGYGLRIDYVKKQYGIFSYAPPGPPTNPQCNKLPTVGLNPANMSYFSPATTSLLDPNLTFPATLPNDAIYSVLFMPPNPTTIISTNIGGATSSVPGKVYLQTTDGLGSVFITVNLAGQVDF